MYCKEVKTMSHKCLVWSYYQRVLNVLYGGINNALNNVWMYQQRLKFIVWRYQQRLECIVSTSSSSDCIVLRCQCFEYRLLNVLYGGINNVS